MKSLILASSSPRRKEILTLSGLPFMVLAPDCDERGISMTEPQAYVEALSRLKCDAGVQAAKEAFENGLVIGADTVVYHQDRILGKPASEEEAFHMLQLLSGDIHSVYTGVTVTDLSNGASETFYEKTDVLFYELTEQEIRDYIHTKEPMDKAGAYGIQGKGAYLVKGIRGDFYNVVGLPLAHLLRVLKHYE